MATYVFVVRETGADGEKAPPVYDERSYIEAMRDGMLSGVTDVFDLHGNIRTLESYVESHCPAFKTEGRLWLYDPDRVLDTRYALLLFGDYHRMFRADDTRMLVDMAADATWAELRSVYPGAGWSAKFVERKFGTGHKKLFLMIAPKGFHGMIRNGTEADCDTESSSPEILRQDLERWIRRRQYGMPDRKPEVPPARTEPARSRVADDPPPSAGPTQVVKQQPPSGSGRQVGERRMGYGGATWRWNGGSWERG